MTDEPPRPAPLRPRILAGLIDLVPSVLVIAPLAKLLGEPGFFLGAALVIAGFTAFEARGGQTPGKRLLGLRVLHLDGSPCTLIGSLIRNVFRLVDAFPGFYLIALGAAGGNRRRQRLGDQAAGTSVYRDADLEAQKNTPL